MKNWNALKERYLSDLLPNRLGGLSANLARIKTLTGKTISQNTLDICPTNRKASDIGIILIDMLFT